MKRPSERILEKLSIAMARGTLVVDENVTELAGPLGMMNIHIIKPSPRLPDDEIISQILPNRIIVTKNSKDFIKWASSYDYGIIALENLKFIDPEPISSKNKTVTIISEVIVEYDLWSKRHGFIINLKDNGKHEYKELTK